MRNSAIDEGQLSSVSARLGDAVIDPAIWLEIMEEVCVAVGAAGAALQQSDIQNGAIPWTKGIDELARSYFVNEWYRRDVRAEKGFTFLSRGEPVITDQDVVTPEGAQRSAFYQELLAPLDLKWFAGIGFWSGTALWVLTIQRARRDGPFDQQDKRALAVLSRRLTETATLSKAIGRAVLSGMTNALHLVRQPALALDRLGFVIGMNPAAEQIFDDQFRVRDRRLFVRDQRARAAFTAFIDRLRITPDTAALPAAPMVVQRRGRPLVIRVLPVDGAACSPFFGARALLIITDLGRKPLSRADFLVHTFGLSPAEARLASLITTGISPERAAEELGIARETARNQLKAVFSKTDTHRQAELVALLSRL